MCVSLQLYSLDAFFKHITLLLVMIRLYFHIFHRNISDAAIYQELNFLVHSHGDGICFVEYIEAMSKKFQVGIFKHFLIILKCFELVFLNNHYKDSHFKKIFAKYNIILIISDQNGFKIPQKTDFISLIGAIHLQYFQQEQIQFAISYSSSKEGTIRQLIKHLILWAVTKCVSSCMRN